MLEKLLRFGGKKRGKDKRIAAVSAGVLKNFDADEAILHIENNDSLQEELERRGIGAEQLKFLLDDDAVSAAWEKRELAVKHRKWSLSLPDSQQSKFVSGQLGQHYQQIAGDLLRSVLQGIACIEIRYKRDKETGQIVISSIEPLSADAIGVNRAGGVYVRSKFGEQIEISEHRILKHKLFPVVHGRTHDRPAGTPLLVSLVWVWFLRNNLWEFWARYLERFGSPLLIGFNNNGAGVDPRTGKTGAEMMADTLENAVNAGVVVVGGTDKVEVIQSGNGGNAFDVADSKISRRIQIRILGQTLTSDSDGKGSYAMADVHDGIRQEIAASDIALITPAIQSIVNSLVTINFPGAEVPVFEIEHQASLNKDRAERDAILYAQGVRFKPDYYVGAYGFKPDEIEITEAAAAGGTSFGVLPGGSLKFSADSSDLSDGQKELDAIVDQAIAQAGDLFSADALKAIVLKAKNPDDLAERFARYYEDTEPDADFSETLASLIFAGDILGYEEADKGLGE